MINSIKNNKICPLCDNEMVKAQPQGTVFPLTLVQHPVRTFTHKKGSLVRAYVCINCGYVLWYVDNPNRFKSNNKEE